MPRKDNRVESFIDIREFRIEEMDPHSKVTLNAKPGIGKSKLINTILRYHRHHIPTCMYIGGTSDSNTDIEGIVPPIFMYEEWSNDVLRRYIKRQKINKREMYDLELANSVIIIDDMTENKNVLLNKPYIGLYKNGRQWANLTITALQNAQDLPKEIRHMTDYIFIGREISKEKRDQLYQCFIPSIISRLDFDDLMDQITEHHRWLVVDNKTKSNKIEDIIFWFKADLSLPPFRFGCDEIWEWDDVRFDPDYEDREEDY